MACYKKAVLISIKPQYCHMIANGYKTVEIRKSKPFFYGGFKVYIYCTKENMNNPKKILYRRSNDCDVKGYIMNGKVIGEFFCTGFDEITSTDASIHISKRLNYVQNSCLSIGEIKDYLNGKTGYGWRISNLKIYDKPIELSELKTDKKITRPPQSWQYIMVEAN